MSATSPGLRRRLGWTRLLIAVLLAVSVAGCASPTHDRTGHKDNVGTVTIATVKDYTTTRDEIAAKIHEAIPIAATAAGGTVVDMVKTKHLSVALRPYDNFHPRVECFQAENTGGFRLATAMTASSWETKVRDAWRAHGWKAGIGELGVGFYLKTSTNVSYYILAYPPTESTEKSGRDEVGFSTQSDCMYLPKKIAEWH